MRGAEYTMFEMADYSKGFRRLLSFFDEGEAVKEAERARGFQRATLGQRTQL